jgi:hypothetical protein
MNNEHQNKVWFWDAKSLKFAKFVLTIKTLIGNNIGSKNKPFLIQEQFDHYETKLVWYWKDDCLNLSCLLLQRPKHSSC